MATTAYEVQGGARTAPPRRQGVRPSHGWLTLLLHAVVLVITADSVVRLDRGDRMAVLVPLALGGLLLGYVVARTPSLDAVSHLLAFSLGAGGALLLSAARIDGAGETWHRRGGNIVDLARRLVESQSGARVERLSDSDLMVAIGLTLWLVGYSSAWMLYRRNWLVAALVVPAALMFISLRFEDREPVGPIATFAFAAMVMAARHQALVRQIEWGRMRMAAPARLPHWFTAAGSVVAVLAMLAGWVLPIQAPQRVSDGVYDQVQRVWERAGQRLDNLKPGGTNNGFTDANYAAFGDSFRIGKQFVPSRQVVAVVSSEQPEYLAARRYDVYNGIGWESNIDATYRMAGDGKDDRAVPISFADPNAVLAQSPDVSANRDRSSAEVMLSANTAGVMLTIGSFVDADVRFQADMGWVQFNDTVIDIAAVDAGELPALLQGLVTRMQAAQFRPNGSDGRPAVVDPEMAAAIEQERVYLQNFPLDTAFTYGDDGRVLLRIDGRLPNYDDAESIRFLDGRDWPDPYKVTGTNSQATAEELQTAGSAYPSWVTQRYLQESNTVTDATKTLASSLVAGAGADNAYDQANVIQQFLVGGTFTYALNSQETPKGRDAVDFFLFDKKIGRCEEYATAMVVMLRSLGVPARLVAGYRAGDETNLTGDYVYRGEQAHTWVEVFFPKYGWIPFEPTPIGRGFDRGDAGAAPVDPTPSPTPAPVVGTATAVAETPTPEPDATPAPPAATTDDGTGSMLDRLRGGVALAILVLTAGVAVMIGVMALAWAWGLRGMSPAASLFARVQRIGRLWGVEPRSTMTPSEYAAAFGQAVPRASRAATVVADLYAAEQYGGVEIGEDARDGGQKAWKSVRTAVTGWRPRRRRR